MLTQEAIKNRRTIHSFVAKKVPEDIIVRAIEAANYAPCHRRTFPWRFTKVCRGKREVLAKSLITAMSDLAPISQEKERSVMKKLLDY